MLPERFGRYEVLAELGDGAMGRVYSAWDPKVSRVVAVKTVKSELLTSATADDYLKRFRREAVAAGGLTHPQVVRVFDIGDDFLVMELVEGRTLFAMIREAGRIEPAETLRLLGPVAEALDHAHRAGIVHRDIKPANVIVQPDGQPKLMDFGVAHLAASVMTTAGQVLGSPSYMAPEQIAGATVTGRCDVYSLAVVAYEMLTGQSPFQGKSITQVIYRVMHEQPAPPRHWNAALPARYDDVFARALAKDPDERFATATQFMGALDLRELEFVLEPTPEPAAAAVASLAGAAEPGSASVADEVATLLDLPDPRPRARQREGLRRPRDPRARRGPGGRSDRMGGPAPRPRAGGRRGAHAFPRRRSRRARGCPVASALGRPAGESAREARDVPDGHPRGGGAPRPAGAVAHGGAFRPCRSSRASWWRSTTTSRRPFASAAAPLPTQRRPGRCATRGPSRSR